MLPARLGGWLCAQAYLTRATRTTTCAGGSSRWTITTRHRGRIFGRWPGWSGLPADRSPISTHPAGRQGRSGTSCCGGGSAGGGGSQKEIRLSTMSVPEEKMPRRPAEGAEADEEAAAAAATATAPATATETTTTEEYLRASHDRLFRNNRAWAAEKRLHDPGYFARLAAGQSPTYLWIGCSDSRIPAEQITGLEPGEAFIHRNIANLVCNTDLNVMAVINYAVRHLAVKHIIVCGHYGCGGVQAAMTPRDLGLLNPWLRNIRDVYRLHEAELDALPDRERRYDRLVELNVEEQCRNVVKTAALQQSYARNRYPVVHGWVFGFRDGLLKDLHIDFEAMLQNVQKIYNLAD